MNQSLVGAALEARAATAQTIRRRPRVLAKFRRGSVDLTQETPDPPRGAAASPAAEGPDARQTRRASIAARDHCSLRTDRALSHRQRQRGYRSHRRRRRRCGEGLSLPAALHIPKTIDNDPSATTSRLGYPSAARFIVQAYAGSIWTTRGDRGGPRRRRCGWQRRFADCRPPRCWRAAMPTAGRIWCTCVERAFDVQSGSDAMMRTYGRSDIVAYVVGVQRRQCTRLTANRSRRCIARASPSGRAGNVHRSDHGGAGRSAG